MSTLDDSLYMACFCGNKHLVLELANQNNNESLLCYACRYGHINLVKQLIDKYGCDPNVVTDSNESLLCYACRYGHINLVELLIENYCCDPNVVTKSNESLLHYACRYGHTNIVEYLVNKQQLNPFQRESINQLEPLDYAISNNEADVVVYICQHCISSEDMLNPDRIKTTINLIKYICMPNPMQCVIRLYTKCLLIHSILDVKLLMGTVFFDLWEIPRHVCHIYLQRYF